MAFRDRVKFTTATTGTGTVTVASAVFAFFTPATASPAMGDGEKTFYAIEDGTASEWGATTYTVSGATLTREFHGSSTGSLLNLSGSAIMYFTPTAALTNQYNPRGQAIPLGQGNFTV